MTEPLQLPSVPRELMGLQVNSHWTFLHSKSFKLPTVVLLMQKPTRKVMHDTPATTISMTVTRPRCFPIELNHCRYHLEEGRHKGIRPPHQISNLAWNLTFHHHHHNRRRTRMFPNRISTRPIFEIQPLLQKTIDL